MPKHKSILAWHFVRASRRLGFGDDNTVAAGYVYEVEGPLGMCNWGLHASRSVWDALYWSRGLHICRVLCSGEIIEEPSKLVATRREVLWIADATAVIKNFACWFSKEHRGVMLCGEELDAITAVGLLPGHFLPCPSCSALKRYPGAHLRLYQMIMALKPKDAQS